MKYSENKYEVRGYWWLPSHPEDEEKIRGSLSFSAGQEIKLVLDSSLQLKYPQEIELFSNIPLIYGESLNGTKRITVCNCREISTGTDGVTIICSNFYSGNEQVEPESTKFKSVVVKFTYLESFIERRAIKYQFTKNMKKHSLKYHKQADIITKISDFQFEVRIKKDFNFELKEFSGSLDTWECVEITPKTPQNFQWFFDRINKIKILLSILIRYPVMITQTQFESEHKVNLTDDFFSKYNSGINYYHRHTYYPDKVIWPSRIPFNFRVIENYWNAILNSWLADNGNLETCSEILFGVISNQDAPIAFQFTTLLEAIESYQRGLRTNYYLPEKDYDSIKEYLLNSINQGNITNSGLIEALKNKIKYGNEYSLRKRLTNLLNEIPEDVKVLITENDQNFISRIVDTRNYLIHRDETLQSKILNNVGIFNAVIKLRILLEFYILRDLGIPEELVSSIISSHQCYKLKVS